ncbi:putative RNA recognition motif domain, nucleotide-binding alpha-beta plait domain superfamily [Helianthus annuus]|nr:putative RNA recognition motif domain, nucleotide-binding alpha-beta plait domain superfamily [Helianthus annuus]
MAALESSLNLSYFHISSSPNPQLQFPTKSNLAIRLPISTPKIIFKTPLPISAIQQELSVAEEHEEEEKEEEKLEQPQKEDNKRKLFVLNLPWSFTVVDVKNFFGECGTVADVEIIKREDGKRGFAFVTMSSGDEALAVIKKFDSHELLGRIIKIEYAKQFKKPTPRSPGSPHSSETCHKLFVSNLAWKVRASNLKQFFVDFNPVSTRVVFGPSGSSAGYGFVSFASKETAESAVSTLNGKELLGRPIILKFSEKSSDNSGTNAEIKTPFDEQHGEL